MQDRYRDPREALRMVLEAEELPAGDVQRLEIGFQANGEVTCRVWQARDEDPVILILTDPE